MDLDRAARQWRQDGFVILPGYLSEETLRPAVAELDLLFPSAQGFHDGTDPRRDRFLGDEFAGIDSFPFAATQISLLAVHDDLLRLATTLLGGDDLRLYSAEAWAKYTGAADYDQDLHRDYLNHTVLVPSTAAEFRQLEMFIFLVDVPEDLGPPHLVPKTHTANLDAKPNWLTRRALADLDETGFVASSHSHLYEREVSAAGPAGTVVAFELGTFHRGTGLTRPGGARYSMHVNYRRAAAEWGNRQAWADRSHEPAWYRFVAHAGPRQLELFGFPPPGHPYWTDDTLAGVALRYPGLDLTPWREGQSATRRAATDSDSR
ncbi:phytanoyl-CoA dioxygenase family protein [Actinomadura soli]|uniref:Phytanoyl-CoA dioxygenase family protein n=1 Tax=Actinomadura soli TaxID=2508997 RepID=A0A5C4J4F6_9ACTN|nr:phytanoyl-CoA dioxygenase family protein [Actinomadura soli]TMQ91621.1 phytanoyl-CoA dioxygenase family protein [Actinomadura soli]